MTIRLLVLMMCRMGSGARRPPARRKDGKLRVLGSLVALAALKGAEGMLQSFHYDGEISPMFQLETFGFRPGGEMQLSFEHFRLQSEDSNAQMKAGFLMHLTESETTARQDIEEAMERLDKDREDCWLDHPGPNDEVIDMSDKKSWEIKEIKHTVTEGEQGLYSLVFVRCKPLTGSVSFKMHAKFVNPGPDYLSAGESPLPSLYFAFFCFYGLALASWLGVLRTKRDNVHHIHHMMAALLFFKTLSLLFEAVRFHYYQKNGFSEGWSIVYYIFAFVKGVMRFVVLLLIGTGWSLLKPYLNDREKKVVLVVLALQVVDNVAMVVLEEISKTSPGSSNWLTWRDIFHLVDIVCCCAILFPIVWSIRHLRQAAGVDGKAEHNLQKLTLFRQFYLMVVMYIYVTRIIIFLVKATLPYQLLWLQQLFDEFATLIFYLVTGYKFRPADENPYLMVRGDDLTDDLEEFGLSDDGDVELHTPVRGGGASSNVSV